MNNHYFNVLFILKPANFVKSILQKCAAAHSDGHLWLRKLGLRAFCVLVFQTLGLAFFEKNTSYFGYSKDNR